jgi:type I restriction enzyme S subunit
MHDQLAGPPPKAWHYVVLGEIAKGGIQSGPFGSQLHAGDYVERGVPVIMPKTIGLNGFRASGFDYITEHDAQRLGQHRVADGDIVVGRKGDLSRRAYVTVREAGWFCGTDCIRIRPDRSLTDPRFLSYYFGLPAVADWLHRRDTGSTLPNLNTQNLGELPVLLPPLHEQRSIAEMLEALDLKIDNCVRIGKRSDDLISALFQAAIRDNGVQMRPLFDVVDFDFGEPFKGEYFNSSKEGRPLIRIRDLKSFESQIWTTEQRRREVVVASGDVLVGMDAEFRPTAWLGQPGVLNQRVCRARGITFDPAFVREALKEPLLEIERHKTGTTVIHLNKQDLEDVRVPVPSLDALEVFEGVAGPLYRRRVACAQEARVLGELRDTLLPSLLSGRLRVRDEALVVDAV